MPTAYDVPAEELLKRLAEYIKGNVREVSPPDWAIYSKTGVHVERAPQDPDWWYVRSASLLRKLYLRGPLGVSRLRKLYGGRKRKGCAPAHFRKAGGSILRHMAQQLEAAGLVIKIEGKGRVISSKGRSLLDAMSAQIKRELEREVAQLKIY
ncbi:MAG: 30S ribosomal protein S19e [Candidatus Bathyarchaeia archaeon]